MIIPILDNGHGGLIGGVYQTPGKRSPKWEEGVLYEGMFNRKIINDLKWRLYEEGIPFYHVSPEDKDISLQKRVNRANKIFEKNPNRRYLFMSVHANAGGGHGAEIYTTRGETMSDKYAEKLAKMWMEEFNDMPLRKDLSDGDSDKEANLFVLKHTMMPAILLEVGFMDSHLDYTELWDQGFQRRVVETLVDFIKLV